MPTTPILVTSPEGLEPHRQCLVAGGIGGKALRTEQPTQRVECRSDMVVAMCVDTTRDARQHLRWSRSSLLVMVLRDGSAVPDRSDGRSRLVAASRANHPNSETGRAALQRALEGLGDDTRRCHGSPSQAEPASTPEAIEDQQSSGGSLREVSMDGDSPQGSAVVPAEAERVSGWIEEHSNIFLRLVLSHGRSHGDRLSHCRIDVVDLEVEVHHRTLVLPCRRPHGGAVAVRLLDNLLDALPVVPAGAGRTQISRAKSLRHRRSLFVDPSLSLAAVVGQTGADQAKVDTGRVPFVA